MAKYKLKGLRTCLRRFDNTRETSVKSGRWMIARGGYDLNWELYYDNKTVVKCIGKGVETVSNDADPNPVLDIIASEYPELKKTYEVTCTMIYNGSVNVSALSQEKALEKAKEMFNHGKSDFPNMGDVGEVSFVFGEVTADYADCVRCLKEHD